MDAVRRNPPILSSSLCPHRAARPHMSCDTGRAAAGRAGSFNSERTIPFFPKWRSVGPEPGRTLFFRIVRTGPPGGGPARSFLPDPLSTSLTHPGSIRDRRLVLTVAGLYKTGPCVHVQPLRDHLGSSFDPRDTVC